MLDPILFKNRRNTVFALSFGVLFCFFQFWGSVLEKNMFTTLSQWASVFVNTFCFSFLAGECYLRLRKKLEGPGAVAKTGAASRTSARRYYLLCLFLHILAYFPVFLAYYPGIFSYDVITQIPQYYEGYSSFHPLIHTLFLQFFYIFIGERLLGNITAGIALASLVQMGIFAACISYVHLFLYRQKFKKWLRVCLIACTALLPFFSILSVSMTKDPLFAGFLGILLVYLFYWERKPAFYRDRKHVVLYIFLIVAVVLLRNNGIYPMLFCLIAGLYPFFIKRKNLKFFIWTGAGIALAVLTSTLLSSALSAEPGTKNEMLSIPYQQVSYVYHLRGDELSEEEKDTIREIIPGVDYYNPHLSDPVKNGALGGVDKTRSLKCYLGLFRKYPMEYLHAVMQHDLGFFYIWDVSFSEIYGKTPESRQGYILTGITEDFGVEHTSYFSPLEKLYEYLYTENAYQNIWLLRVLCSPATYFWLAVLFIVLAWDLKRLNITCSVFTAGLLLTYLAGPCTAVRYALSVVICVLVLLAMALCQPEEAGAGETL